ncbi:MAG: hypothetical protein ACYC9L_05570 [Sulfuricaulis sp.]
MIDADKIIELAVEEMGRRLEDDQQRSEISAAVLAKFVSEANEVAKRRKAEAEAAAAQAEKSDVLAVLRSTDLPASKKRDLAQKEIKRLQRLIRDLEQEAL